MGIGFYSLLGGAAQGFEEEKHRAEDLALRSAQLRMETTMRQKQLDIEDTRLQHAARMNEIAQHEFNLKNEEVTIPGTKDKVKRVDLPVAVELQRQREENLFRQNHPELFPGSEKYLEALTPGQKAAFGVLEKFSGPLGMTETYDTRQKMIEANLGRIHKMFPKDFPEDSTDETPPGIDAPIKAFKDATVGHSQEDAISAWQQAKNNPAIKAALAVNPKFEDDIMSHISGLPKQAQFQMGPPSPYPQGMSFGDMMNSFGLGGSRPIGAPNPAQK